MRTPFGHSHSLTHSSERSGARQLVCLTMTAVDATDADARDAMNGDGERAEGTNKTKKANDQARRRRTPPAQSNRHVAATEQRDQRGERGEDDKRRDQGAAGSDNGCGGKRMDE